jgi:hypothetical protein
LLGFEALTIGGDAAAAVARAAAPRLAAESTARRLGAGALSSRSVLFMAASQGFDSGL